MENLTTAVKSGKAESGVSLPQALDISRDPQTLLAEWDLIWSAYMRGQVEYREVTLFCSRLSEARREELWADLQERRRRQFEETAWG